MEIGHVIFFLKKHMYLYVLLETQNELIGLWIPPFMD